MKTLAKMSEKKNTVQSLDTQEARIPVKTEEF